MVSLIVECNMLESKVIFKNDEYVLSTLVWGIEEDYPGFYIENAPTLANVYINGFYVVDNCATMRFIMNVAEKIRLDQHLLEITYFNNSGEQTDFPFFLTPMYGDEEISVLPRQQLAVHEAWEFFCKGLCGYLNMEFIDNLDNLGIIEGFMDVLNAELSILWKND